MGCLARLGCLIILVLLACIGWLTRDRWMSYLHRTTPAAVEAAIHWEPLTPEGAQRAQKALDTLGSVRGPVFQNVAPGDAAAWVLKALLGRSAQPADSAAAAVVGNQLLVRANLPVRALGGRDVLGSIAALLGDHERVQVAGTFHIPRPGVTEYRVTQLKVGRVTLPGALIPKILGRVAPGAGADSASLTALRIPTPKQLADIRVADGRLTLYKGLK